MDGFKNAGLTSTLKFGALGSLSKNLQIRLLGPVLEREDLELTVDVGDANTLLKRLMGFHLDAILCDVPYPHSEEEPLLQRQIAREHFCLVIRKTRGRPQLSEELKSNGIYLPSKSNPATSEIEVFLKSLKTNFKIKGYIDDIALLRLLALETNSVVAIPKIGAERELTEKSLIVLHEFRSLFQKFYLVLRQNSVRSTKVLNLLRQNQSLK